MNGIVKFYNEPRGFGFITPLVGRPGEVEDVFVHRTGLRDCHALPNGAEVRFITVRGTRGPQAVDVRMVPIKLKYTEEIKTDEGEQACKEL